VHIEAVLVFVLAAVTVVVVVRWLAERTGLPAAALLPMIGIIYAYLPGPNLELDPHLILTFILPPLLYSAALDSSLLAIRRNLRTVVSLSVVLVLLTALLVGVGFALFVTGATMAVGVALGAAVAPPDPVAALAVGHKAGLPPRLLTLIQGEGLLNDATALTLLSVAAAAVTKGNFSFPYAAFRFVLVAAGGVVVGVVVAYLVRLLRPLGKDPLIANAISLATPFVAYLAAEQAHVSGVLAVVVAGLIIGHYAPGTSSGASRLQTSAVWRLVDFLLEGFVFLLIGQQLKPVVRGLKQYEIGTILAAVGITLGVVLLLRPLWLLLTQSLPRSLHTRLGNEEAGSDKLTGREVAALSWAGTRGVISLAAIFTLLPDFPLRDLLLFCTFVVVVITLVVQGVTFAPLVRALGLRANAADQARLRNQARSAAVQAALDRLDDLEPDVDRHAIDTMRQTLHTRLRRYQGRLDLLEGADSDEIPVSPQYEAAVEVRRAAIEAQREELLRWRDAGQLPDEGLRRLERELDHEERMLPDRR
jgi:CPA1 family monovalent cation:H+ antiporter